MKTFNLPDDLETLRLSLLEAVSRVADLRFVTVKEAADKIGIPAEQLNHLLRDHIGKVTMSTVTTIYHRAGITFNLSHSVEHKQEEPACQ